MKKKKIWIWIVSIVGLLVITAGAVYFVKSKDTRMVGNSPQEMGVTVQKAMEKELTETILVTGEIVPESVQKVFLEPAKGKIIEYKVEENQQVKVGDPLFVYDSSKLEGEITRAVREKSLIQGRAKTELTRINDLTKRIEEAKKSTQTSGESAEKKETTGQTEDPNQLTNEKIQLELQYESTKAEIASADERIKELTNQKNDMTVLAKIDGIVVKVNQNVAATETGSNEPVVHIISSQPYKVIGTMSEFDAVKIKPGQEVIVRPKVFKERQWKGAVESVSQFPNENGGGQEFAPPMGGGNVTMYPFKVAITDDTSELRQGFHVSLEIKISGEEKKLVIPHTAIKDEGGIGVVFVLKDGKLERREVITGSMNDEFIQITEGVVAGEQVVLGPSEEMHDGMEVISYDEIK